jgi:hypothetical protein
MPLYQCPLQCSSGAQFAILLTSLNHAGGRQQQPSANFQNEAAQRQYRGSQASL